MTPYHTLPVPKRIDHAQRLLDGLVFIIGVVVASQFVLTSRTLYADREHKASENADNNREEHTERKSAGDIISDLHFFYNN